MQLFKILSRDNKFYEEDLINFALKIDYQNELFIKIKNILDDIEKIDDYQKIFALQSLINRNIEKNKALENVKLIKENFQKKILSKHPNLTANDIYLAGLIKLNYSSKQIAEILSINVSSVETKRSRLRKKMNLSVNQNLFNILNTV